MVVGEVQEAHSIIFNDVVPVRALDGGRIGQAWQLGQLDVVVEFAPSGDIALYRKWTGHKDCETQKRQRPLA